MLQSKSLAIPEDIGQVIVISDLHALTAPLAIIDDIVSDLPGQSQVIAAGDYFVNGLHPKETLDWVRHRAGEFAILGNHDEGALGAFMRRDAKGKSTNPSARSTAPTFPSSSKRVVFTQPCSASRTTASRRYGHCRRSTIRAWSA